MPTPLLFFGSGAFGLPTLQRLAAEHQVLAIITQPDRPAGRGGKLTPTPIAQWASEHAPTIPILKPEKCNAPEVVEQIRAFPAKTFVVIAFGQKIGKALLADRFALNLHASLLPRWRGAAPINAAILAGDTRTGNSVITLADKMDAGEVLGQTFREILPTQTVSELHDLLAADGPSVVFRVLREYADGSLIPEPQDESKVTLAGKLSRADAIVDFAKPATDARCRINGLSPWPGITAAFADTRLKLLRAGPVLAPPASAQDTDEPGTLVDPKSGIIACANRTWLQLLDVQPLGKRAMPWPDFINGNPLPRGVQLACVAPTPEADA
jgi:methionyl-tRNA formyltransferase